MSKGNVMNTDVLIHSSRHTILVVEDELINRELLKNILESNYNVLTAENGRIALDMLRGSTARVSMILLDINMPVMNGFETDPKDRMNRMSSGQLKKTYISFALSCNPRYLFMDEPTNGLDIPSKAQFRKAISHYTSDDSTIVISTHQVRDLEDLIDPIMILDRQDVLLNASLEEISSKLYFDYGTSIKPESLYTEQLPGGIIEALFNAVHKHKELIKNMFR